MRLDRKRHGAVRNSVCYFCEGVSRAGSNHKQIKQLFRAERLDFRKRVQNGSAADVFDPFAETFRRSETCVRRISICRHYRHDVIARQSERFHLVYHFFECAERPAESVAYPRTSIFHFHIFHRLICIIQRWISANAAYAPPKSGMLLR